MVEIKSLDLKNYRFAGCEATKWPTDISPWPSAMGMGITSKQFESCKDDRNNFEF